MPSIRRRFGGGSKYGNQPVVLDGIRFDSKAEGEQYLALKLQQEAGLISDLTLQPHFLLLPAKTYDGRRERAIFYVADFSYREDGRLIVAEVKGYETETWRLKRRLFLHLWPTHELRIIKV